MNNTSIQIINLKSFDPNHTFIIYTKYYINFKGSIYSNQLGHID